MSRHGSLSHDASSRHGSLSHELDERPAPGVYPVATGYVVPSAPPGGVPMPGVVAPAVVAAPVATMAVPVPVPIERPHTDVVATRVFLQPIAPPQPLGFWGFSLGAFVIGAYYAGWFGTAYSLTIIAPFAFFAGGLLQFIAAHMAFRARDAYSTVAFGIWSSLFFAVGLLWFLVLIRVIPPVFGNVDSFAIWWVPLAALTLLLTGAALLENLGVMLVYLMAFFAAVLFAASYFWNRGDEACEDEGDHIGDSEDNCQNAGYKLHKAAGYLLVFSAAIAMYVGLWFLLSFTSGRDLIPMYRFKWAQKRPRIHGGENEPGVKKGM